MPVFGSKKNRACFAVAGFGKERMRASVERSRGKMNSDGGVDELGGNSALVSSEAGSPAAGFVPLVFRTAIAFQWLKDAV